MKRVAVVGIGFATAMCLVACSGESAPDEAPNSPPDSQSSGVQIQSPKDAAKVDVCDLLPAEAASSIGLEPEGEVTSNMIDSEAPDGCEWGMPDDSAAGVLLTPLGDRSIDEYLQNKEAYADFAELTVAGHPAVRANQTDPAKDGFCDVFLGTKDGQVLSSQATSKAGETTESDPCGMAQKALEASVPTLPAAG